MPRLRPGERPAWWNAGPDREHFGAWRRAAAAHRLSVDTFVALLVELDLVVSDLGQAGRDPFSTLAGAVATGGEVRRLGPAGPLRHWLVDVRASSDEIDELPELVLPERLVARLTPGSALGARVDLAQLELAVDCDRRAAAQGRTLESWALHVALFASASAGRVGDAHG